MLSSLKSLRTSHSSSSARADVAASEYLNKLIASVAEELSASARVVSSYSTAALDYDSCTAVLAFSSLAELEAGARALERAGEKFEIREISVRLLKKYSFDRAVVEHDRRRFPEQRVVTLWKLGPSHRRSILYRKVVEAVVSEVKTAYELIDELSMDLDYSIVDIVDKGRVKVRNSSGSVVEVSLNSPSRALCAVVARGKLTVERHYYATEADGRAAVVLSTDWRLTRMRPIDVLDGPLRSWEVYELVDYEPEGD